MSTIANIWIKKETLETILKVVNLKNVSGIALDISINDETDKYGNNVKAIIQQSKDDRDAKKQKFYVGNGKVVWTDGKPCVKPTEQAKVETNDLPNLDNIEDLPF